jgi:hypothetical protein
MFEKVTIRLRIDAGEAQSCFLVTGTSWLRMHREESDGCFDYYAVQFEVTKTPLRYYFEIISRGRRFRYFPARNTQYDPSRGLLACHPGL